MVVGHQSHGLREPRLSTLAYLFSFNVLVLVTHLSHGAGENMVEKLTVVMPCDLSGGILPASNTSQGMNTAFSTAITSCPMISCDARGPEAGVCSLRVHFAGQPVCESCFRGVSVVLVRLLPLFRQIYIVHVS
jgi:hypothetical protein